MGKASAILVLLVLALVATAGYYSLDQRITAAEGRISVGERQLAQGRSDLRSGRARLEAGKKDLARNQRLFGIVDEAVDGGRDFKRAGQLMSERGGRQIAAGEEQVASGERRLAAGGLLIRRGREQLRMARIHRLACGVAAAFFTALALALSLRWAVAASGTRPASS